MGGEEGAINAGGVLTRGGGGGDTLVRMLIKNEYWDQACGEGTSATPDTRCTARYPISRYETPTLPLPYSMRHQMFCTPPAFMGHPACPTALDFGCTTRYPTSLYGTAPHPFSRGSWASHPLHRQCPKCLQILVTSTSVIFLFLYPTLNKATTKMYKCDTLILDVNYTEHLLRDDYSIDCTEDSYQMMRYVGLGFLGLYGFGIPIAFVLVGLYLRKVGGHGMEMNTLAFLFVGFKYEYRSVPFVNGDVPLHVGEGG